MLSEADYVLITGGAGAIGVNLIEYLLEYSSDSIIVLDNLSSGRSEFIERTNRVKFYYFDISQPEKYQFLDRYRIRKVFHLAAHFANQNSVDFPMSDAQTNALGSLHLLEYLKEKKLESFVYASSSCVYGNSKHMHEELSITPSETPYAIHKYVGELYCQYYREQYGVPTNIVRLFNSYGPYELAGEYRNVIPNFIDAALKGVPIKITGTGDEKRDFTYVADTCHLLNLVSEHVGTRCEIFNSGTGEGTSIIDLVHSIEQVLGFSVEVEYHPRRSWDHVIERKSDIKKAQSVLGYSPSVGLREGLSKTMEWHQKVHRSEMDV